MKGKKFLIALIFGILVMIIGYGVYNYSHLGSGKPRPIDHPPIVLNEGEEVLFFRDGFAINGRQTRFFSNSGREISFPFTFAEKESIDDPVLTAISENYVLLNSNLIYKFNHNNLEKVHSLEGDFLDIDEVGNNLLLIAKEGETYDIKCLDLENLDLRDLIPDEKDFYLDYSLDHDSVSLSILTLNVDDPFPVSQAYHLDSDFGLFGAISHNDELFYKIFRFPKSIVLIGNQRVVCYNIEGELEWELGDLNYDDLITAENDSGLLIYSRFPFSNLENEGRYNGLYITKEGEIKYIDLPKQLSQVIPYGNRFLCIQYDKDLLVINDRGKVIKEYATDKYIKKALYNPREPKYLYLIHKDNRLQVYSTVEEESQ